MKRDEQATIRIMGAILGGVLLIGAAFLFGFIDQDTQLETVHTTRDFLGCKYPSTEVVTVNKGYGLEAFIQTVLAGCVGCVLGYQAGDGIAKELYKG